MYFPFHTHCARLIIHIQSKFSPLKQRLVVGRLLALSMVRYGRLWSDMVSKLISAKWRQMRLSLVMYEVTSMSRSVGYLLDMQEVTGSNPISPTIANKELHDLFAQKTSSQKANCANMCKLSFLGLGLSSIEAFFISRNSRQ